MSAIRLMSSSFFRPETDLSPITFANLWLWTRMPDDRESNLGGFSGGGGAYPTVRRINFGLRLGL